MQRQQPKKANKMQSQRAAPRKQSKKNKRTPKLTLQGPSRTREMSLPTSYASTLEFPTWLRMEGKVNHPEFGGGVRIAGRQLLTSVTTTAGDSQLFTAAGATLLNINKIWLSPDTLNGRLAQQARAYDRYVFRKVALHYMPRVAFTQEGSFALGFVSDSVTPAATFANVTSMNPCKQSDVKVPFGMMIVDDMSTTKTFFCLLDSTSDASTRQCVQGTIVGLPDVTSIGAVTMGSLYVDYLIDLYQPTIDQGFTLRLTDKEIQLIERNREASKASVPTTDISKEIGILQQRIEQLKTTGNMNL